MTKVTINGEVFDYDPDHRPLAEYLEIEHTLKIPYAQVEEGLKEGRADSLAAFIWQVWHRNGRDVAFADIIAGKVDIDMGTFEIEKEEGEADPTTPPPPPSSTTAGVTSESSLNV